MTKQTSAMLLSFSVTAIFALFLPQIIQLVILGAVGITILAIATDFFIEFISLGLEGRYK